jgi:4-amino-4-deoxy-L-arabinose transferase-like glycosyltransferase
MARPINPYGVLLAVFLIAFGIRLALTARLEGLSSPPRVSANPDSLEYERIAYNVASGHGYGFEPGVPTAARPPGTSLTLLPPYLFFGRSFLAAHCWLILLSAVTCVTVGLLGRAYGDRQTGLIAAIWLALYPGHVYYSMHLLSETVYGFWLSVSCGLSIVALARRSYWADIVAGLGWGMAILTRVELIVAVPIAWLLLPLSSNVRRMRGHLGLQTAIAVLLVSLWVIRNTVTMGVPTLSTQRGYAFWGAHNPITLSNPRYAGSWVNMLSLAEPSERRRVVGTEAEKDKIAWNYGMASIQRNLSRMPYLTIMKLWRLLSPFFETSNAVALWGLALGWLATGPFVGYGIWIMWRDSRVDRVALMVALVPMLATVFSSLIVYGAPRFRDALAPLFIVFAAAAVSRVAASWHSSRRQALPPAIVRAYPPAS